MDQIFNFCNAFFVGKDKAGAFQCLVHLQAGHGWGILPLHGHQLQIGLTFQIALPGSFPEHLIGDGHIEMIFQILDEPAQLRSPDGNGIAVMALGQMEDVGGLDAV